VNPDLDRRTFLRGSAALALPAFGLSALLAACGGSDEGGSTATETPSTGSTASGSSAAAVIKQRTLRMPLVQDIQPPDPDTYFGEAMAIVQACYEGLLDYVPGTSNVRGQLAESWTVSDDGTTYTFKLKPNVKFHDGTIADAASWVKSIERRRARNQGPAYMVKGLTATAPDPVTLVMKLSEPNIAFVHYLACPWRFFAVSPTAVAANEVNGDLAKAWLATHDAGTGPYMFTAAKPGTSYTLEAFPDWRGTKPQVNRIEMSVIPDGATRRLQLDSGDFDIIPKGLSFEDLEHFRSDAKFTATVNQAPGLMAVELNPFSGVLANKELRTAVFRAINRQPVLDQAYKGEVKAVDTIFSEKATAPTRFTFDQQYDPNVLRNWVKANGSVNLDLAYTAVFARMGELIGAQLSALGVKVTTRTVTSGQQYAFGSGPANQRPDILVASNWSTGDGLHIDTGLQIQLYTGSTLLNYFGFSDPKVDALIDEARRQRTDAAANAVYQKIADILNDMKFILPLGHDIAAMATPKTVGGLEVNSYLKTLFYPEKLTFTD
jgi:peptide/nickel transport system substrate-binding protein